MEFLWESKLALYMSLYALEKGCPTIVYIDFKCVAIDFLSLMSREALEVSWSIMKEWSRFWGLLGCVAHSVFIGGPECLLMPGLIPGMENVWLVYLRWEGFLTRARGRS